MQEIKMMDFSKFGISKYSLSTMRIREKISKIVDRMHI
jgi:hypothetical protein